MKTQNSQLIEETQSAGFSTESIDIWQSFLIIVRYKLQLAIFVCLGLVFGIVLVKNTAESDSTRRLLLETIEGLKSYKRVRRNIQNSAFDTINSISDRKIYITNDAEYRFDPADNSNKKQRIKIKNFEGIEASLAQPNPPNIYITYKQESTINIKNKLRTQFEELYKALNIILEAQQNLNRNSLRTYMLNTNSNPLVDDFFNDSVDKAAKLNFLAEEKNTLKSNISKARRTARIAKNNIERTAGKISNSITFDPEFKLVPLNVWKSIVSHESFSGSQVELSIDDILKRHRRIENFILQGSIVKYLYENQVSAPRSLFKWSRWNDLKIVNNNIKRISANPKIVILISIFLGFLVGVVSIALRRMIELRSIDGGWQKAKQDLLNAIKHSKL